VRRPITLLATTALLAGCAGGADDTDPVALEAGEGDTGEDVGAPADEDDAEAAPADPDEVDGDEVTLVAEAVDGTEAIPGTWEVGDAGTITFDVVDGALVLEDVSEDEGWTVTDVEEEADEIEVDFERGDVEIEIEVELTSDATILEVEIDTDIEDAGPGTYEIGEAGSFTFDVVEGQLELTDLTVTDGWEITEQDVGSDEIEIELRNGAMRWDADVDLNGSIEIELDYEVASQL
jgi:hypothetical protein